MLHSFEDGDGADRLYHPAGLVRLAASRCGVQTGNADAGMEALEPLCQAFEQARPKQTAFGKLHAQAILLDALAKRFRLADYLRRFPEIAASPLPELVFIVAPFRTGTTFLHRLLSCDPENRWPRLWEVAYPPPGEPLRRGERRYFAEDGRIGEAASALRMLHRASPEIGRLHPMEAHLPEECFGLLETSFLSHSFLFYAELPSYLDWLDERCTEDWLAAYQIYANQLRLLNWWYPGRRWVLKAPVHLWNLESLLQTFPQATVIQLHRDPVAAMVSFSTLLAAYRALMCKGTRPQEAGAQASSYTCKVLQRAVAARLGADARQFIDVSFVDLVRDPVACVRAIYARLGARLAPKASAWLSQARPLPQAPGSLKAGLETFGLDACELQDMFAGYAKFLSAPEGGQPEADI